MVRVCAEGGTLGWFLYVTGLIGALFTGMYALRLYLHVFRGEPAPFVLGFVLGPLMEENFRRAMYLSHGNPMTFIQRPISAALLALTLGLLVILVLPAFRKKREEVFRE